MNNEELRKLCLSFPHASEDSKWGNELCFSVGGKMFCASGIEDAPGKLVFRCTPEKFTEITKRSGVIPAPKVAKFHWVALETRESLAAEELEDLISRSYLLAYEKLPVSERLSLTNPD